MTHGLFHSAVQTAGHERPPVRTGQRRYRYPFFPEPLKGVWRTDAQLLDLSAGVQFVAADQLLRFFPATRFSSRSARSPEHRRSATAWVVASVCTTSARSP